MPNGVIYLRTINGDGLREAAPLAANHWIVKEQRACPWCEHVFHEGDITTLVPMAAATPHDRDQQLANKPYTAIALVFHHECGKEKRSYEK